MSELTKHPAESLKTDDKFTATLRHKTDGSKNIHSAEVIVVENHIQEKEIVGYYNNGFVTVPYNEIYFMVSPKFPENQSQEEQSEGRGEGDMTGYYSPLFKFFNEEHNLILLDSEIQEIIHEVEKFQKSKQQ